MLRKNIALLAGGFTGEYGVSVNSAKNIKASLDSASYQVYTILINHDRWVYTSEDGEFEVDKNDFTLDLKGEKVRFDFAFITIHGTPGEDGKIQGYLDMLGIPYNTCDATTSAITMNKAFTKAVVNGIHGLHTAPSVQLLKSDDIHEMSAIAGKLKFPLFVKPNNGGSSVGMSKVHNVAALPEALEKAFHEEEQALVEEFISGREFSIGIARLDGQIKVLPATEIISLKEFFDYEAKYEGASREITPAELSDEDNARIRNIVTEIYLRLNCKGMVRIDFILQEGTGDFYFIEVNTTPGQSANSLIPQQVRAAGRDLGEFYGQLIEGAMPGRH